MDAHERIQEVRSGEEFVLSMATYSELVRTIKELERAIARMQIKMTQLNKAYEGFGEDLQDLRKRVVYIEVESKYVAENIIRPKKKLPVRLPHKPKRPVGRVATQDY
jgi:predicted  nucleic acid-binding Zn-ribbon protein